MNNRVPENEEKDVFRGVSRRDFVRYLVAGSALSITALNRMNAAVYQSITSLNQKYIEDESPDGVYWEALSKHFMFQDGFIMMNNGTVGPMPKPVFNTLLKAFKVQATNPYDVYSFIPRKRSEVRAKVAAFLGTSEDNIVLTRNTTEGMNFSANGLDLKEGDEILLSDMEHPGGTHPWNLKRARYGITIKTVPLGLPSKSVEQVVGAFEKAITPKTKAISISQTVFISGLIAPIKELCEMAHKKGVLVIADSAHGIGMLDMNLETMGVDLFATSPYKWLGAPCGVGVFYVKKELQDKLWPTIASSGWDREGTAARFETLGQRADPLIIALGEAIDFQNRIGKHRIEKRIKTMAGYLKRELGRIPGIKLHTPMDPYLSGGLTAFSVEGVDPRKMVDYVREKYNIVIRTIGNPQRGTYGVRVSTHIFVSMKHIDMFLEGVGHLARRKV
ncbi:MAG: aminotransferase class V-fold PLP-dependent enzyme [Candidatus Aminicenantes bacterium]|nr:aminotransferase class V-fold PLP-dependent enzyme [Candidatus Aminicenantes bacterium]